MRLRAATDWLVESCQPAPARALSTRGAKTPNTTSTTAQPTRTRRKWVDVHNPSLANTGNRPLALSSLSVPTSSAPDDEVLFHSLD